MRRKIAAILVAHIADYGRLLADAEDATLRRMASSRSTTDHFIAMADGRLFNTAGDALLAEFSSAVEAVRCAIDIQESLRTRNLAYPGSRQLSYRIGIGLGDVVEREGDLLGDGVNIAARLEGLAEAGGICISRAVYEQVTGKLSAQFVDIGARKVKNIPEPVHAYLVVTWEDGRSYGVSRETAPAKEKSASRVSVALIGAGALCVAALALLVAPQRLGDNALSNSTAAVVLPPASTTPPAGSPPASSSPPGSSTPPASSTPVPASRRTSSAKNEPEVLKRSFEYCSNLALQRGWGNYESRGRTAFVEGCLKGDL